MTKKARLILKTSKNFTAIMILGEQKEKLVVIAKARGFEALHEVIGYMISQYEQAQDKAKTATMGEVM